MKYLLSYDARYPAKAAPVSAYYDEDIEKIEKILELAAQDYTITRELTAVIASGVQFAKEQGEELERLQRALYAAQSRIEELEGDLATRPKRSPRWISLFKRVK